MISEPWVPSTHNYAIDSSDHAESKGKMFFQLFLMNVSVLSFFCRKTEYCNIFTSYYKRKLHIRESTITKTSIPDFYASAQRCLVFGPHRWLRSRIKKSSIFHSRWNKKPSSDAVAAFCSRNQLDFIIQIFSHILDYPATTSTNARYGLCALR